MKNLLFLLAFSFLLFSCETEDIIPPDDPQLFFDITYEVIGNDGRESANITYGRWDEGWVDDFHSYVENAVLPWDKTTNDCGGHAVAIGVSSYNSEATSLTLRIYKDGVVVLDSTTVSRKLVLCNVVYNIPREL